MASLRLPCFAISGGSSTAIAEPVSAPNIVATTRNFIMKIASSDHRCEKGSGTHFSGRTENLGRGAGFHDDTMVHVNDGVGNLARKAAVVGHYPQRHPAASKVLHDRAHRADQ